MKFLYLSLSCEQPLRTWVTTKLNQQSVTEASLPERSLYVCDFRRTSVVMLYRRAASSQIKIKIHQFNDSSPKIQLQSMLIGRKPLETRCIVHCLALIFRACLPYLVAMQTFWYHLYAVLWLAFDLKMNFNSEKLRLFVILFRRCTSQWHLPSSL